MPKYLRLPPTEFGRSWAITKEY